MTGLLTTLAWRNLWRNKRRTLIMLSALGVGVWAMIWMTAMLRGMVDQMVEDSINNLSGHIQIHAPGFRSDPSITNSLEIPSKDLMLRLQQDDIVAWSARLRLPAMISSERHNFPVTIVGIDPDREEGLSFIMQTDVTGKIIESSDDKTIIIGNRLKEKLETRLNKRLVIMTQNKENDLSDRGFKIKGIYHAKLPLLEQQYVFTGLHTLQKMLDCSDCITEISLKTTQYHELQGLKASLVPLSPETEILSWQELDPYTETMLDTMNGFILVFIIVIFVALSFGLVNTLIMAIFERSREIALVHALGLTPRYIALQILIEAVFLICIGLVAGNLLALFTLLPVTEGIDISFVGEGLDMAGMSTLLKPTVLVVDIVMANTIVITLGVLACLLPAIRASQKAPAAALNRNIT